MSALKYWLWLTRLRGLRSQTRLALLRHFTSPEEIYYADPEEILLTEGIDRQQAQILSNHSLETADKILGDCDRLGVQLLTMQDAAYPGRLRDIYDPPCLLYIKGRLPLVDAEAVIAVVGTRECTPYGVACAERISYGLASAGAIVASGLARGIDSAASRGALMAGGVTLGLVANGLDVIYPKENRALYEDIAAAGALISEYPPGTSPLPGNFPLRNRILSGLSVGTLVVEAPEYSGALITASLALEQGRDVFAVPGPIDARASRGCNALIRDGAGLASGAEDIVSCYAARFPGKFSRGRELPVVLEEPAGVPGEEAREGARQGGGTNTRRGRNARQAGEDTRRTGQGAQGTGQTAEARENTEKPVLRDINPLDEGLTDDQITLLRVMDTDTPIYADDLIENSGIPARRVLSALTLLEIDQFVLQHSGKRYTRLVNLIEEGTA